MQVMLEVGWSRVVCTDGYLSYNGDVTTAESVCLFFRLQSHSESFGPIAGQPEDLVIGPRTGIRTLQDKAKLCVKPSWVHDPDRPRLTDTGECHVLSNLRCGGQRSTLGTTCDTTGSWWPGLSNLLCGQKAR